MKSKMTDAKQVYQQKLEANLEKLQVRIDKLKAKADQATADARLQYHDKMEALTAKQQETQNQLHQLKAASEDAWHELKIGTEAALYELQNAFNNALAQFKK